MTVQCQTCGEEWPRDPALEVPCPVCQAAVGIACKRPSGYTLFGNSKVHAERDESAMAAGLLRKCAGSRSERPTLRGAIKGPSQLELTNPDGWRVDDELAGLR